MEVVTTGLPNDRASPIFVFTPLLPTTNGAITQHARRYSSSSWSTKPRTVVPVGVGRAIISLTDPAIRSSAPGTAEWSVGQTRARNHSMDSTFGRVLAPTYRKVRL